MTQSSWQAVADRIVAQMNTIAGIGRVHNRVRLVFNEDDFADVMTSDIGGEVRTRAWMVHLEMPRRSQWLEQGGTVHWWRTAVIEGFAQVEDAGASEHVGIGIGEQIIRTLNADVRATRLGGNVLGGGPATFVGQPGQIRTFGFVVCHYVRIELPVFTAETPT